VSGHYSCRVNILGILIHNLTMPEAVQSVRQLILEKTPSVIVTPNVDVLAQTSRNIDFKNLYRRSDLIVADGMPLVWAARLLGTPLKTRVSGADLFPNICKMAAEQGYSVFLLGGKPDAAKLTSERLMKEYPGLKVSGIYCPPYGFENNEQENAKIIRMLKDAKPDVLFVGLGTPKQEKWIFEYKELYGIPVSMCVGGSFELYCGMLKRAPLWMQKTGLEWLWRLMIEPRRLWKRYLVDDLVFVKMVFRQILNKRSVGCV